jgi:WD40 repeat protein
MPDSYNMSDVFLSYSRKDVDFVKKLFSDMKEQGKEVWADFEDIPVASDWWNEIRAGIDAADAFVFVISPDSVNSTVCRREIDHAIANNKRFLPLLYREVTKPEDKEKMHPAISSHNWIYCRENDDYDKGFETLMTSIGTDLEHNRNLSRILVRAKDWESHNSASSYLLVGDDLSKAESWLTEAMSKKPAPTALHSEFIHASRVAAAKRQRRLLIYSLVGLVVAVVLTIYALVQTFRAEQAVQDAELARDDAIASEQFARSLALAASSGDALSNNNPDLSLVLALEAVKVNSELPQVYSALAGAAYAPSTRLRLATGKVVMSSVFAPDGLVFAAGFADGDVCLYSGDTGEALSCLKTGEGNAHSNSILFLHISGDGSRVLSSSSDNRLVLWDISDSAAPSLVSEITVEGLRASAFSSAGDFALFGLADGRIGYWDLQSAEAEYFEESFGSAVNALALNGDNSLALSGAQDGQSVLWDVAERVATGFYFNPDNDAPIISLTFSPDSTLAVVGDHFSGITIYNLETQTLARTLQGHNESIRAISFSANGRSIYTVSWDRSIREWDLDSGREVNSYRGHDGGVNTLSLSADNTRMVSGGFDNTIRIWHVRPAIFDRQYLTDGTAINSVDWNAEHIVTAHNNGYVHVIDRLSGDILQSFEHVTSDGSISAAINLQLSPSGQEVFVVYRNCDVAMFNVHGERVWERSLPRLSNEVCRFVLFRPASEEVLVGTDSTLLLLDARDGGDKRRIPYSTERGVRLISAAFLPDGNQLMIGENYYEGQLSLIDVQTGDVIRSYAGHQDGVLAIRFNQNASRMVTGSFDNDVRVWDVATGEVQNLLEGHSDRILSVEFSPNEAFVVSSDNARAIRLWDLQTGYTVYIYSGHTNRVVRASFSPDGQRILTASYDSTVILWKFPQPLEELVQWAEENRYIRELSCSEYQLYVGTSEGCAEATETPQE